MVVNPKDKEHCETITLKCGKQLATKESEEQVEDLNDENEVMLENDSLGGDQQVEPLPLEKEKRS